MTNTEFQTDIILTEREWEAADVAELQAELDQAELDHANAIGYAEWEADMLWATREWNYR